MIDLGLLKNLEFGGHWWIPEREDAKVYGVFKFAPDGFAELHLQAPLLPVGVTKLNITPQNPLVFEYIIGQTEHGHSVCLRNCTVTSFRAATGYLGFVVKSSAPVSVRTDVQPVPEVSWPRAMLSLTHLNQWIGVDPISHEVASDPNGGTETSAIRFDSNTLPGVTLSLNDFNVDAVYFGWPGHTPLDSGRIEYYPQLRIRPLEPRPIDWFLRISSRLSHLFSLLVNSPVRVEELRCEADPVTLANQLIARPSENILFAQGSTKPVDDISEYEVLLSYSRISHVLPLIINSWLENYDLYRRAISMILQLLFQRQPYIDSALFSLISGLEGFHRIRHPEGLMPPEEYALILPQLSQRVIELADNRVINKIHGCLTHAWEPSIRNRLQQLRTDIDPSVAEFISNNWNHFIETLRGYRDGIAHQLEQNEEMNQLELHNDLRRAYYFLLCVVLRAVGIPSNTLAEALDQHLPLHGGPLA